MCKIEPRTASILLTFAQGYISCLKDFVPTPDDDIWCSHTVDGVDYDLNFYDPDGAGSYMIFVHGVVDGSTAEQLTDDLFTLPNI